MGNSMGAERLKLMEQVESLALGDAELTLQACQSQMERQMEHQRTQFQRLKREVSKAPLEAADIPQALDGP